MTNENEIITLPEDVQTGLVAYSSEDIAAMATAGSWLARLSVTNATSELVTADKIKQGVFALVFDKDRFKDMGKQVDAIFITMRPKALRLADGGVFQYFNRKNPEFEKIMADSNLPNSGCMFGLDFLIWIPSIGEFASFYCGSKSSRRESPLILGVMNVSPDGQPAVYKPASVTLESKFIPKTATRKNQWWSFTAYKCSSPLNLPEMDDLKEQIEKFNKQPESTVTKAEPVESGRER